MMLCKVVQHRFQHPGRLGPLRWRHLFGVTLGPRAVDGQKEGRERAEWMYCRDPGPQPPSQDLARRPSSAFRMRCAWKPSGGWGHWLSTVAVQGLVRGVLGTGSGVLWGALAWHSQHCENHNSRGKLESGSVYHCILSLNMTVPALISKPGWKAPHPGPWTRPVSVPHKARRHGVHRTGAGPGLDEPAAFILG